MSWIITVPKGLVSSFLYEVFRVKTTGDKKFFRVAENIKAPKKGDVLYVVYDGAIRGCMPILSLGWIDGFECTSTGNSWEAGNYLECELTAYKELESLIECKGFQGIRRVDFEKFPELKRVKI